jgi:hypothetical protein
MRIYIILGCIGWNDLTAEGAENIEGENREMNNSEATEFDITRYPTVLDAQKLSVWCAVRTLPL